MKAIRWVTLALCCSLTAWSGYRASILRGQEASRSVVEALAAAGEEETRSSDGFPDADDGYRISSLNVFSNVAIHIQDNYVDPARIHPKEMLVASLREVERQVAEVLIVERSGDAIELQVMDHRHTLDYRGVESLWEINLKLREAFRFLEQHLPESQDLRSVEYAAVNGALSTLDPHSVLLKPEAFQDMKTSTKGEFGGLGIVISIREGQLAVVSPLDDTPAARAGLKAGDAITRIGEVSTVSMPIEEAVRMLRGPEGSKVTVWIKRKGWPEARQYVLVRERIKIRSVEGRLLSDNVGYIKIKNFQQHTGRDLEKQLQRLGKKADGALKGLILDLRNNPGGLLEQAIKVSDKFVTSGDIVTTVGMGNKLREPKRARWSGTETELAIAVLVNKGAASASEIVAGALKNLDRAVIIGERTFGKGSVQVLYDFADNSALKLTIAQYLTPGGISIQNEGVTPDIRLRPAWVRGNNVRLFYEPSGHRERNLDKHLERGGSEAPESRPAFELKYLVDPRDEKPADEAFQADYPVRFARRLLLSAASPSRTKMLKLAKGFMKERAAAEESRLVEKMSELGVNWQLGREAAGSESLKVSLKLAEPTSGAVKAGENVTLEAIVRNAGPKAVHRLHGTLDSEHMAFKGREFLFGYLAPGESKKWTITTKVPKETSSRADLVRLTLAQGNRPLPVSAEVPIHTQTVDRPQFGYSFVVDDSDRGDGDGRVEAGEGVDFQILVHNEGPGDADEVNVRLKSAARENLFLERGRVNIGPLKSGETKAATLRFRVRAHQSMDGRLPLEVTLYDAGTGEWLEDRFTLQAEPRKKDKNRALRGGLRFKQATLLRAWASPNADVLAEAPKGFRAELLGRVGGHYRLRLPSGAVAFAPRRQARVARHRSKRGKGEVRYFARRRPPRIVTRGNLSGSVVRQASVGLEGEVVGRDLRDMYVLLNDEKVYFARGPGKALPRPPKAGARWRAPDEARVRLPFRVPLNLNEGLNKVVIVARLNGKVMSHQSFYIARHPENSVVAGAFPDAEPAP